MHASFYRSAIIFSASLAVLLGGAGVSIAADLVTAETESGTLGTNFLTGNSGGAIYISNTNNNTGNAPGIPGRVASYSVSFPAAGTYDLYARVRIGAGGASDDSFVYANGFGSKSPTTTADWVLCNNLWNVGFTNASDTVTGAGTVQTGVWKWLNLSQFNGGATPINFTVTAGNLTQTFQIGGREDGLDLDKFAFGTTGTSLTVSNLDSGIAPNPPPLTNAFVGPDGIAFHRFSPLNNGINADGANPAAGLALSGGVLWGTTLNGGALGAGTAFFMAADGSNFVAFRSFSNTPDAGNPAGELAFSGSGFFGASFGGGSAGVGAVFVGQTNGGVSLLRNFTTVSADNATNFGGASPTALIALSGNALYGTTTAGGAAANGAIFSLSTNGATFSVLYNFSPLDSQTGTNAGGATPWGGLLSSGDKLYGTASAGGAGGNGVVFSISTNGANFTTLYNFSAMDTLTGTNTDGAIPYGGLVLSTGTLYGTTFAGGNGGRGTIFSIQTNGLGFTLLHHFTATDATARTNTDGASPSATLMLSSYVLYGTASAGGSGAAGTVFSLSLNGTLFTTLRSFTALASNGTNTDGAFPVAPVLQSGNSLYGTTFGGGPGAAGTVFSIPLPVPPALITNIVRNANGSVTLYFLGGPNSTNVIQATSNLTSPIPWQSLSTNVADANGAWQFTDNNNTTRARFYRSYVP